MIEGENSITANTTVAYNGIFANSTGLTISGDGHARDQRQHHGINVYSLTIESGTLKITAGQHGISANGGVSGTGGVTIKGGEIEISGTGDNFRAFDSYTNVTADPRAGKQICVSVGESEADAEPLGPYTSEFEIYKQQHRGKVLPQPHRGRPDRHRRERQPGKRHGRGGQNGAVQRQRERHGRL